MYHPTDRITHTPGFLTPVVEHWLERKIAQWFHPMKDQSDDPSHHEQTLLPRSYVSLPSNYKSSYLGFCCHHPTESLMELPGVAQFQFANCPQEVLDFTQGLICPWSSLALFDWLIGQHVDSTVTPSVGLKI